MGIVVGASNSEVLVLSPALVSFSVERQEEPRAASEVAARIHPRERRSAWCRARLGCARHVFFSFICILITRKAELGVRVRA